MQITAKAIAIGNVKSIEAAQHVPKERRIIALGVGIGGSLKGNSFFSTRDWQDFVSQADCYGLRRVEVMVWIGGISRLLRLVT